MSIPICYARKSKVDDTDSGLRWYYQSQAESTRCMSAIDEAIETGTGMDDIVRKFGLGRADYVLATAVENDPDSYSEKVRSWADGIKISNSGVTRMLIAPQSTPEALGEFIRATHGLREDCIYDEVGCSCRG